MSYPDDIDEMSSDALIRELKRRERLRDEGFCDYCERPSDTTPCRFPNRHCHTDPALRFVQDYEKACQDLPGKEWSVRIVLNNTMDYSVELYRGSDYYSYEIHTIRTFHPLLHEVREAVRAAKLIQEKLDRKATEFDRKKWTE